MSDEVKITNEAIGLFIEKMKQYAREENPEGYMAKTVINDIVYFLGISIDKKEFGFAHGHDKFVAIVIEELKGK